MKVNELRHQTIEALKKELLALLKEQLNLRMQKTVGESVKPHHITRVRKDIARVKTVLREKEVQL